MTNNMNREVICKHCGKKQAIPENCYLPKDWKSIAFSNQPFYKMNGFYCDKCHDEYNKIVSEIFKFSA